MFIGDDWAAGHHDIGVEDDTGRRLARRRLPEGIEDWPDCGRWWPNISIPTPTVPDRCPHRRCGRRRDRNRSWSVGVGPAGLRIQVYAINPMSAALYRERHDTAGAKSDTGDAHVWPRSCRWTGTITVGSPGTPRRSKRQNSSPGLIRA
jgi:hypothetical protein